MEPSDLKSAIEALLFVASQPLKIPDFAKMLEQEKPLIQSALGELVAEYRESGIIVLENNGEYQLATNSKHSALIKNFLNADLREKLTDTTVEVLAIITYRQPISKAELEAIRGVNSQYSLRNLLMRGLIEKTPNPHDARGFLYQTTTEFLQHLGLVSVKDLPDFESLVSKIKLPLTPQLQNEARTVAAEPPEAGPAAASPTIVPHKEPIMEGAQVHNSTSPVEEKFKSDDGENEE